MTDLEIFSPELEAVGLVDIYSSILWERRYAEAGFFEISAPMVGLNGTLLEIGNLVVKPGALESGVIEQKRIAYTDTGATVTVSGRFLSYLLHGHIVMALKQVSGNAEAAMRELVESTVMSAESSDYLPKVALGELAGIKAEVDAYCDYPDLHDYLAALARQSGVLFRLRLDVQEKALIFECYEGKDRSILQTENPQIVFSEDDETIANAEYERDRTAEVNAAVARYTGPYGSVIVEYNPENLTGTEKRAISVEGECVTYTTEEGGVVLDVAATRARLLSLAKEQLHPATENITATAAAAVPEYKGDYDLGDIVTVHHAAWGKTLSKRIEAITETENEAEKTVIPTFGSPLPTIADILKAN